MVDIISCGHICLDFIPEMTDVPLVQIASPGRLFEIGRMEMSVGGSVSNTGLALHRLGVDTALMGCVGDDTIGQITTDLFREHKSSLTESIRVRSGSSSSYSVLLTPQNEDRIILHCTGTNALFSLDDVDFERVAEAKIFHLGYPPLLPMLLQKGGAQLKELFRRAKLLGVITSLDMSMPDPGGISGQVNWQRILTDVLPYVDIFVPSIEEIMFMLRRAQYEASGGKILSNLNHHVVDSLLTELLDMGTMIAGLKMSHHGIGMQITRDTGRLQPLLSLGIHIADWEGVRVYQPAFKTEVAGTTGAGDSAYAGILAALINKMAPVQVAKVATTVAAMNISCPDAISGLRSWKETLKMLDSGWEELPALI